MVGACRPAAFATSVNCARNGMPEGFPRGVGCAPRVATPCPLRSREGTPAIRRSRLRRVTLLRYVRILRIWFARLQTHLAVNLFQMFLHPVELLELRQFPAGVFGAPQGSIHHGKPVVGNCIVWLQSSCPL